MQPPSAERYVIVQTAQPGRICVLTHQEIAPAIREAISQKTVQSIEGSGPSRHQAGLRRIIERRYRQSARDDLSGPFELGEAAVHREAARRQRFAAGLKGEGDVEGRARRQPHGVDLRRCARWLRIPTQAGRGFRFDPGRRSDLKPATIPR